MAMPYLAGVLLALAISGSATVIGFDRSRSFYPLVLIAIASYYCLFAAMSADNLAFGMEISGILIFAFAAVVGFKKNLWIIVGALCFHGIFDAFHGELITNRGTPIWWPAFCLSFDVTAGAYLAWRLTREYPTRHVFL